MPTALYRASVEIVVWGTPENGGLDGNGNPQLLTVTNRRWGGFSLVGGKVEEGENIGVAAGRELEEETGCVALTMEPLGGMIIQSKPKDAGHLWFCMAHVATIGDQKPAQVEEGTVPSWQAPSEVWRHGLYPDYYKWLRGFLPDPPQPSPRRILCRNTRGEWGCIEVMGHKGPHRHPWAAEGWESAH